MITFEGSIWMVAGAVDMRQGIEGLSHHLIRITGRNPCQGEAFLFRNKANTRIKILIWDGNGVWLCHRQLLLRTGIIDFIEPLQSRAH